MNRVTRAEYAPIRDTTEPPATTPDDDQTGAAWDSLQFMRLFDIQLKGYNGGSKIEQMLPSNPEAEDVPSYVTDLLYTRPNMKDPWNTEDVAQGVTRNYNFQEDVINAARAVSAEGAAERRGQTVIDLDGGPVTRIYSRNPEDYNPDFRLKAQDLGLGTDEQGYIRRVQAVSNHMVETANAQRLLNDYATGITPAVEFERNVKRLKDQNQVRP